MVDVSLPFPSHMISDSRLWTPMPVSSTVTVGLWFFRLGPWDRTFCVNVGHPRATSSLDPALDAFFRCDVLYLAVILR